MTAHDSLACFLNILREFVESLSCLDVDCVPASRVLEATDDDVDIERIEFNAAADAAGLLASDLGRAGAQEGIDDDLAAIGEVKESVFGHCGRLHRWVILEATASVGTERTGAGVGPNCSLCAPYDLLLRSLCARCADLETELSVHSTVSIGTFVQDPNTPSRRVSNP